MNRQIVFAFLVLSVAMGCASTETKGSGGGASVSDPYVQIYDQDLARSRNARTDENRPIQASSFGTGGAGGSGGSGGAAPTPEPDYCVDLLLLWVGEDHIPPTYSSVATDQALADLQTCMAPNCATECAGTLYASPPVSINGGPNAAACKACFIIKCHPEWDACINDHDPANLCYGRYACTGYQACNTETDCPSVPAPICLQCCKPDNGIDVGACFLYEE